MAKTIGEKEKAARAARAAKAAKTKAPKPPKAAKPAKSAKPKSKAKSVEMDPKEEAALADSKAKAAARAAKKGLALPAGGPAAIVNAIAPTAAAKPARVKAEKPVKPPKDWTVKPVIASTTNKAAQQLIDRIEAASLGDEPKKALAEILAGFKPCNTYYKMAHRYGTALHDRL